MKHGPEKNGHKVTFFRVYTRNKLPSFVQDIDFLIVMGGPQDPATSVGTCPHLSRH